MSFIHFHQPIEDSSILCEYLLVRPLHCSIVIMLCVSSYFMPSSFFFFFSSDSMVLFFYSRKSIEPILYICPSHDLAYFDVKPYYSFLCQLHYLCFICCCCNFCTFFNFADIPEEAPSALFSFRFIIINITH